jgi:putative acetyltransferase
MSDMTRHPSPIAGLCLHLRTSPDLAPLADLWVASWQEAMPEIDFSTRKTWFLEHLNALETAGAVTICAFDGSNRLLGFVNFDPAAGYLDQIAVAPDAKGSGAARLLLTEARRLSPGGVTLEVNQDNPRALRFYEREGFEKFAEAVNPISGLKTWRLRQPPSSSGT